MDFSDLLSQLMTVFTGVRDAISRIESDRQAGEQLKTTLVQARNIYDGIVNIRLKDINASAFENHFQIFVIWLYDIEYIIDEQELKLAEQRNALAVGTSKLFEQIFTPAKLERLSGKLNNILTQWENILQSQATTTPPSIVTHDPYLEGVKIIGRESETKEIVEMLLSCKAEVGISIIGMRGLGKTSLAHTIMNHFSHRKWVNIEDGTFDWNKIKAEIEPYIRKFRAADEVSIGNVYGHNAHKLLIVFDNLLVIPGVEWDTFWDYTRQQGVNKSVKIIITTRDTEIPEKTHTAPYHLKVLSNTHCEEVIVNNANMYMEHTEPLEPSILSAIAQQCEGLPWIAQRIGNTLGVLDDEKREAIRNMTWLQQTSEFQTVIFPHLALNYINMKPGLRRCFGYFSLFPVHHRFDADDLVRLWIGECFVKEKQTGKNYVDDLKRSLIIQSDGQENKLQSFGHYFAVLVALGTCLHLDQVSSLPPSKENIRHLSLSCHIDKDRWTQLKGLRLRTFLSLYTEHNPGVFKNIPLGMKESLLHLRVLSLMRTCVTELPNFIEKLKHLRYLDVSFTPIKALPKTLHKLIVLQTLKVKGSHFSHWRSKFYKLTYLRYVDWEQSDIKKKGIPRHVGKVSLLESLPLFMIGTEDGYSIKELKEMNKLQGSICIENLQLVAGEAEARRAMLHDKHDLRTIKLQWAPRDSVLTSREEENECAHHRSVLTGLKASEKLRELIIINYKGNDLPEWISNSKIEKVHLEGFSYHRVPGFVPALGKMKELKILVLEDMESIDLLSCRSDGDGDTCVCFPKLESLEVHDMPQLSSWTGVNACDMPRLRQMKFVNCPQIDELFLGQFKSERPSVKIYVDDELIPNEEQIKKRRKVNHRFGEVLRIN